MLDGKIFFLCLPMIATHAASFRVCLRLAYWCSNRFIIHCYFVIKFDTSFGGKSTSRLVLFTYYISFISQSASSCYYIWYLLRREGHHVDRRYTPRYAVRLRLTSSGSRWFRLGFPMSCSMPVPAFLEFLPFYWYNLHGREALMTSSIIIRRKWL